MQVVWVTVNRSSKGAGGGVRDSGKTRGTLDVNNTRSKYVSRAVQTYGFVVLRFKRIISFEISSVLMTV